MNGFVDAIYAFHCLLADFGLQKLCVLREISFPTDKLWDAHVLKACREIFQLPPLSHDASSC